MRDTEQESALASSDVLQRYDAHHVPHLAANQEVRERRDHLRHPVYKKPELLSTGQFQYGGKLLVMGHPLRFGTHFVLTRF